MTTILHVNPAGPDDVDPDLDPPIGGPFGPAATPRLDVALVIALGGGLGGLARLGVNTWLPHDGGSGAFPWSTLAENVLGCFLIGALIVCVTEVWATKVGPPHRYVRPFLGTGVLGGFTTFSAYTSDARLLLADGHAALAGAYLSGTLVMGLVAVVAGQLLVRRSLVARTAR